MGMVTRAWQRGEFLIGEAEVLRPEEQGDVVLGRQLDELLGHLPGGEVVAAHPAQAGRGADHVLEGRQGPGQVIVHLHAVQQLHRRAGGQHGHAVEVQVQGLHRDEALEAHVAGGPGHGADVLRQPRPEQDHRHPIQTHPDFRVRLFALFHPVNLTYPARVL